MEDIQESVNGLMRSISSLGVDERCLVKLLAEKTDSQYQDTRGAVQFTPAQFAKTAGIREADAYGKLKSASERLFGRSFSIYGSSPSANNSFTKTRWLDAYECNQDKGVIKLFFSNQVCTHLPFITRSINTTLDSGESFKSIYSRPVLELCKLHIKYCQKTLRPVKIPLLELRGLLHTPKSYSWADVRVRAIEVAVQEIHGKGGIYIIDITPYKKGRKVAGINFYVKEDDQLSLF